MTARWPVVVICARCGDLETAHELRTDGRTRGKRLGQTAGSDGNVRCEGFEPGRREERPPEGELRRRLAAVVAVDPDPHVPGEFFAQPAMFAWQSGYEAALTAAILAATGEDPAP